MQSAHHPSSSAQNSLPPVRTPGRQRSAAQKYRSLKQFLHRRDVTESHPHKSAQMRRSFEKDTAATTTLSLIGRASRWLTHTPLSRPLANPQNTEDFSPKISVTNSVVLRTDQPHSQGASEMEAAHISPELPIRWVVSADRTVEIKEEVTELGCDQANERILQEETPPSSITERVRTDQPHSQGASEMEAAHISPELPIRWVVSADRTVEIKEEVTELGCDQANERILQEETPPSSITERGTDRKLSELEPVPIKDEAQEKLETVYIKQESPVLESVHIEEESPVLESVHIKRVILNSKPLSSSLCHGCGKSFNPAGNLEASPGKTLHRCAGCVKTFRESGILNGQQQTGTGKTPYNCHECGADFRPHSSVKHHLPVLKLKAFNSERSRAEVGGATDPGEQRSALLFIHSECAWCLAGRVRCCVMSGRNPCLFPDPTLGASEPMGRPLQSPQHSGLFAQPGLELAPSKLRDSSCVCSGSALTG
ncbi:ZKSC2 protein, partial [Polyodon spathula]|nr:ZKSC2 protein [Polyodon spathula]